VFNRVEKSELGDRSVISGTPKHGVYKKLRVKVQLHSLDNNVDISSALDGSRKNIKSSPKTVYVTHGLKMCNQWSQEEHSKLLHETKRTQSEQ
jgi:hypothetical protein